MRSIWRRGGVAVSLRAAAHAQIRRDATAAYADVQKEMFKHVSGVFTNPSDKRS